MAKLFSRLTPPAVTTVRDQNRHPIKLSQLLPYFGEFMTRDISVTDANVSDPMPFDCFDNTDPTNPFNPTTTSPSVSVYYCSRGVEDTNQEGNETNRPVVPFYRSPYKDGYDTMHPRASISIRTAFFDLSHIYGQDEETVFKLRSLSGGKMALSDMDGLPLRDPVTGKFIVADDMTRSNPGLFSLAVIFLRYHNLLADQLANRFPQLDDEELFQLARMETIAVYQNIVEEKYVPSLLMDTLDAYKGYDPTVNPSIDEFFSTVAFRYGHSAISGIIRVLGKHYEPMDKYDPLLLRDVFWNIEAWVDTFRQQFMLAADGQNAFAPTNNTNGLSFPTSGLEPFLRGLTMEPEKDVDVSFVQDMTIFTKMVPSINIQRGRDHGIPTYNRVRQFLNFTPFHNFEDLLSEIGMETDPELADILSSLYMDDIHLLDSYVGALLETEFGFTNNKNGAFVGPTMVASLKDQFTRLRNGDRLWYKNRYYPDDIFQFPSLSEIVKMVFPEDQMASFPDDSFLVYDEKSQGSQDDESCAAKPSQMSLLDGMYVASWLYGHDDNNNVDWIEIKITVLEKITGGYIGIGWHSQTMGGSTIWFCKTVEEKDYEYPSTCSSSRTRDSASSTIGSDSVMDSESERKRLFSCCVSRGKQHQVPHCATEQDDIYMELDVTEECLAEEESSVTIRARVCTNSTSRSNNVVENNDKQCFDVGEKLDFIAAYHPYSQTKAHGVGRRHFGMIDLTVNGTDIEVTQQQTQQRAVFALHGAYMLCCWMVVAPVAIFIARYMRHHWWWLHLHFGLMVVVISTTIPLMAAAFTAVGGTSSPSSDHKIVGIIIVCLFPFISGVGVIRRFFLYSEKTYRRLERLMASVHRNTGRVVMALTLWNCYTGLIRIGPADSVSTILGSEPKGYDYEAFGVIRKYLYIPYVVLMGLIFLAMEFYQRSMSYQAHRRKKAEGIFGVDFVNDQSELETMSVKTFKEKTLNGRQLCVVDGYVIDICEFINRHPGGKSVLRLASGTDITRELLGEREVDGKIHVHSAFAFKRLETMVVARMETAATAAVTKATTKKNGHPNSDNSCAKFSIVPSLARLSSEVSRKRQSSADEPVPHSAQLNDGDGDDSSSPDALQAKKKDKEYLYVEEGIEESVVYERAQIESFNNVTPRVPVEEKPVIHLSVLVPRRSHVSSEAQDAFSESEVVFALSPGMYCLLRVKGSRQEMIERPQTPVRVKRLSNGDILYEFYVSMIPRGQLSLALQKMRRGEALFVMKPSSNFPITEKINSRPWRFSIIFAAGTGLSPCIQLMDYLSRKFANETKTFPVQSRIFLVWILRGRNYNYMEECGLKERIEKSNGLIHFILIYNSSSKSSSSFSVKKTSPKQKYERASGLSKRCIGETMAEASISHCAKDNNGQHNTSIGGDIPLIEIDRKDRHRNFGNNTCDENNHNRDKMNIEIEQSYNNNNNNNNHTNGTSNNTEALDLWKGGYITNRLDEQLMRRLFASANDHFEKTERQHEGDEEEETEEEKIPNGTTMDKDSMYDDVLVTISGRSEFEYYTFQDLENIGVAEEQIINFCYCD